MGLNKNKRGLWVAVSAGKLRQRSNVDDKDATKRTIELRDKTEKVVYERVYDDIDGMITGITMRKGEKARQWILTIEDGEDTFNLTFAYDSKYARSMLERLPNVNFEKPVSIMPYSFKNEQDKMVLGITIKQDGEKVPSYYREYDTEGKMVGWLNGIPESPPYKEGDFDENEFKKYILDLMDFFEDELAQIQDRILEANPINYEVSDSEKSKTDNQVDEKPEDNDLPF